MAITCVLAASDGSDHGDHAVDVARTLATGAGADLSILGVETDGLPMLAFSRTAVRRAATAGTMLWSRGVPGVEIVRQAEHSHSDLVVLGRRTRSPDAPLPLGPTSDAVIRRRHRPTLMVPWNVSMIRRVVIALDGTRRGLGVLTSASELVFATGAEPTVVCVITDFDDGLASDSLWSDPRTSRITEALRRFPVLGKAGVLRVRRGSPVQEILAVLEETSADALVLGVRRGGPAGEMGSGHVGRDLLQTAPGAILTVPI